MPGTSSYEVRITRAGRELTQAEAVQLAAHGHRVSVIVVSDSQWGALGIEARVGVASDSQCDTRAYVEFTISTLDSEAAAIFARVARVASRVADAVDEFLVSHHYSPAR